MNREQLLREYRQLLEQATQKQGRISFQLAWFEDEQTAVEFETVVMKLEHRYNGGFNHGMLCGREKPFDGANGFAVSY